MVLQAAPRADLVRVQYRFPERLCKNLTNSLNPFSAAIDLLRMLMK